MSASRSAQLDKALARTSDSPLRIDNQIALLKDGAETFDDWLASAAMAGVRRGAT